MSTIEMDDVENASSDSEDETSAKAMAQRFFQGIDIPETGWTVTVMRVQPPVWEFEGMGRIDIAGWIGEIEDDTEMLNRKALADAYGGGKYKLLLYIPSRKNGAVKTESVRVGAGPPKMPTEWQLARLAGKGKWNGGMNGSSGGASADISGAEANIANTSMRMAADEKKEYSRARERAEDRARELMDTITAEREEKAQMAAKLTALELTVATLKEDREGKWRSEDAKGEREIKLVEVMQRQMEMREAAHRDDLNRKDQKEAAFAESLMSPVKSLFESITALQSREREVERQSNDRMLEMLREQGKQSMDMIMAQNQNALALRDQQLQMMQAEMQALKTEGRKGLGDQIKEIATVMGSLKELGVNIGGSSEDGKDDKLTMVLDRISENAEHLPQIINALGQAGRSMIHGPQAGPPQPAPGYAAQLQEPAMEEQPEPQQDPVAELAAEIERILDIVVMGFQSKKSAKDIAGYVLTKHEAAAMKLVPAPVEGLVGEVVQRRPDLGTAAGQGYIREVHTALVSMVN